MQCSLSFTVDVDVHMYHSTMAHRHCLMLLRVHLRIRYGTSLYKTYTEPTHTAPMTTAVPTTTTTAKGSSLVKPRQKLTTTITLRPQVPFSSQSVSALGTVFGVCAEFILRGSHYPPLNWI